MDEIELTEEEIGVAEILGQAWNAFLRLDDLHPSDKTDFMNAIHAAQNIVFSRSGYRQYLRDTGISPYRDNPTRNLKGESHD